MKAVIMAGGLGTRIAQLAPDIPKPMIPVGGKPVLEHTVECLRKQGICDLIFTVSHLAHVIVDYFGDGSKCSPVTGEPFGVHIAYYHEKQPLGNAGALFKLREKLTEDFLLLNADVMFNVDLLRMYEFHKTHGGLATILTHPNNHPYDSGLVFADEHNAVTLWTAKEDPRPEYYRNRVNAGVHILSPALLDRYGIAPQAVGCADPVTGKVLKVDLDRKLLKPLAGTGLLFCYDSPEYVKDMGTPERYEQVQEDLRLGRVEARNLSRPQKAVFLDRDGTINRYVGFLRHIDQMELLPEAAEGIQAINRAGYLCIVVTNQPVVARGEVTFDELDQIHNKMETLLGAEGAYVDRIYFCPHHPDKGFEGEVPELKIVCDCRKPKPGMLLQAAKDYNIDLSASFMVGDDPKNDMGAGKAAGCRCVRITDTPVDETEETAKTLLDFAKKYIIN